MAESFRLFVLKKLCDHLQGVTVANGYSHDLTGKVYRGRMEFGANDNPPRLSIIEATTPGAGLPVGYQGQAKSLEWPLFIQGWVVNDNENPGDPAYALMADVDHRLGRIVATNSTGKAAHPDEYLLGSRPDTFRPLITGLRYGPGVVRQPESQVSSQAFFFLPIWVGLAEEVGKPYVT